MTNSNYTFKDGVLPILVSARIRLSQEQRQELKQAYYQKKNALQPTATTGTGGLKVETSYGGSNYLDKALGFTNLVFSDLVNTRDSINISIILRLQQVLDVELITEEKLVEACKSYASYIFMKAENE